MKASFTFKLPEDDHDFKVHSQALEMYFAIWEWIHNVWRHYDAATKIYQLFDYEDWQYEIDKDGKSIDHDTLIDNVSPYTMISLVNTKFYRYLKSENINLEI